MLNDAIKGLYGAEMRFLYAIPDTEEEEYAGESLLEAERKVWAEAPSLVAGLRICRHIYYLCQRKRWPGTTTVSDLHFNIWLQWKYNMDEHV